MSNFNSIFYFDVKFLYFFSPLIFLLIINSKIKFEKIIFASKLCLLLIGIVVFIKSFYLLYPTDRILWYTNIGIMLMLISWINISEEDNLGFLLTIFSNIFAIYALVMASTRTSLILLVFVSLFYIFFRIILFKNNNKVLIFFSILLLSLIILSMLNPLIIERFLSVFNFVANNEYLNSINHNNSLSVRFHIANLAFRNLFNNIIFGNGFYTGLHFIQSSVEMNEAHRNLSHFENSYLNLIFFQGLFGLFFTLFFIIIYPLYFFYISLKNHSNKKLSLVGICLIIFFALLGFFDSNLSGKNFSENIFFIYYLALIYSQLNRYEESF